MIRAWPAPLRWRRWECPPGASARKGRFASRQRVMREVRIELGVGYLDEGALQNRATNSQAAIGPHREDPPELLNTLGGQIVLGGEMKQLAVELDERAKESAAQRHRALDDRVEHRLHVSRRAADHPQDLGRGRLLLKRFPERAPQHFDLALESIYLTAHLGVRPLDGSGGINGRTTLQAELGVGRIVLLAPRTCHARA